MTGSERPKELKMVNNKWKQGIRHQTWSRTVPSAEVWAPFTVMFDCGHGSEADTKTTGIEWARVLKKFLPRPLHQQ